MNQYAVWPPFAAFTAANRRGYDFNSFSNNSVSFDISSKTVFKVCIRIASFDLCVTAKASNASSVLSFIIAPRFSAMLRSSDDPGHCELSKKSRPLTRRICWMAIAFMLGALSCRKVTSLTSMTFLGSRKNRITASRMILSRK